MKKPGKLFFGTIIAFFSMVITFVLLTGCVQELEWEICGNQPGQFFGEEAVAFKAQMHMVAWMHFYSGNGSCIQKVTSIMLGCICIK